MGNPLLTNAYWTGHHTTSDIGENRSFSIGEYGIYMLGLYDSSNREMNSQGVLMHELNHQYDAPDHYHEWLDDAHTVCRGGVYCSCCGTNPRPYSCIMCNSRTDILRNDIICEGCKSDMISHLEGHHTN